MVFNPPLPLGSNLSGTNYNGEADPKGVGQEPNIEGWGEGKMFIHTLITLILTFAQREKGLVFCF